MYKLTLDQKKLNLMEQIDRLTDKVSRINRQIQGMKAKLSKLESVRENDDSQAETETNLFS